MNTVICACTCVHEWVCPSCMSGCVHPQVYLRIVDHDKVLLELCESGMWKCEVGWREVEEGGGVKVRE